MSTSHSVLLASLSVTLCNMDDDAMNRALGSRIRHVRKAVPLTQRGLADKVGVSRSYITQIENGIRTVSFPVLRRIANALDVTLEELLGDAGGSLERRRLREQREKFEAATRTIAELASDPRYDIVAAGMADASPEERIRLIQELLDSLTPEQRAKALEKG